MKPEPTLIRRGTAAFFAGAMLFGAAACGDDDAVDVDVDRDELEEDVDEGRDEVEEKIDEGKDEIEEELDEDDEGRRDEYGSLRGGG